MVKQFDRSFFPICTSQGVILQVDDSSMLVFRGVDHGGGGKTDEDMVGRTKNQVQEDLSKLHLFGFHILGFVEKAILYFTSGP